MPHSFGYRARTRQLFARKFRQHGITHMSTYLAVYRVGDIVDIVANAAIQKGMPHKYYHGRTGVIYNVSNAAVGIIINKRVGNRYIEKRVNIRIEHVRHSKCRLDFLRRVKENAQKRKESIANKTQVCLKRFPAQPRLAHFVNLNKTTIETLSAVPYEALV